MTGISDTKYFNKFNNASNQMFNSGFSMDSTANSENIFGGSSNADLMSSFRKTNDVSSYVHEFFNSGNEDFMSSMIKFPQQNIFSSFNRSYGGNFNSNYDSKYDKSQYAGLIKDAAKKYGVDPKLAMKIAQTESGFNSNITSRTGNYGIFQIGDSTAQFLKINRYDVHQNIDGGVKYLAYLQKRYNGDMEKTVAAYNAGPGAVDRNGGIPPYRETQQYVRKVLG